MATFSENNNYQLFTAHNNVSEISPDTMTILDTIIYNMNNNFTSSSSSSNENIISGSGLNDYIISKEELDNIKNKKNMNILSKFIEKSLNNNPNKMYQLTKYTLFEIDEIQAEIYISVETNENGIPSYFYKIISKNIYYEFDDEDSISEDKNKDLVIYDNYDFDNIISLLEDINYVKSHHKILDYYLLSPENMEEALAQREFIPINQDKICSVCYETTIEYTTCKHSICLKCREKCIVQGKKMCPICRNSDLSLYPLSL